MKTPKKEYLDSLIEKYSRYTLESIQSKHKDLWDRELESSKKVLSDRDSSIKNNNDLKPVLDKIKQFKKDDAGTHLTKADNDNIKIFMSKINGPQKGPGIHALDRVNNLPNLLTKNKIEYYDYVNQILSDNNYDYNSFIERFKNLEPIQEKAVSVFYSILKFLQDSSKYIIYYTYWENLMKIIYNVNIVNYRSYCDFYTKLKSKPLDNFPKDIFFNTFMNCIGYLIAKETLENYPNYENYIRSRDVLSGSYMEDIFNKVRKELNNSQPEQSNTNLSEQTSSDTQIKELPLNLILYGPPGTGKTYNTVNKALEIIDRSYSDNREENRKRFDELVKEGQIQFITFHQSMSYEDFIEGIKPETEAETKTVTEKKEAGLKYQKVDGIFKKIALEAAKEENKSKNFVLIIDEINRGNIAEIFGELITLIEEDKRIGNAEAMYATLPYTHEKFGVPNNLYIIGTMNTADRSVESLDTALRRRFSFEEMMPNYDLLNVKLSDFLPKTDGTTVIENDSISGDSSLPDVTLGGMLKKINLRIQGLKDREHQIGHAYFMGYPEGTEERKEWLKNVFKNKVVPLLQEYFYGDFKQIAAVLGPSFVTTENYTSSVFVNTDDFEFDEVTKYDVLPAKKWETLNICEALKKMALE